MVHALEGLPLFTRRPDFNAVIKGWLLATLTLIPVSYSALDFSAPAGPAL
jgi:hypothetical protein